MAHVNRSKRKDIEIFINDLNRDKFTKLNGAKYTGSSKADIKKFLRQFYKWFKGDNEFYPKEVSWIKSRIRKDEQPKEKPVLSIKDITKFSGSFDNIKYKTLVLMLFDSGFRIQEMMSVKKKDLTFEKYSGEEKCFWVMCNESKTLTRKVPVPLFTEDIQMFVNSSGYKSLRQDDFIFPQNYDSIRLSFRAKSLKLFEKIITPHALRHSSATYYSNEYDGNMNLIASRYGWSFSSKELKTYIRRSGAYQKAGAKKIYENEVVKMKEQVRKLENKNKIINEALLVFAKLNLEDISKEKKKQLIKETINNLS